MILDLLQQVRESIVELLCASSCFKRAGDGAVDFVEDVLVQAVSPELASRQKLGLKCSDGCGGAKRVCKHLDGVAIFQIADDPARSSG